MQGKGVSKGLCYAKALVLYDNPIIFPSHAGTPQEEADKFLDAQEKLLEELKMLQGRVLQSAGKEAADIIDTHCSILQDDGLLTPIREKIASGGEAAQTVGQVLDLLIEQFANMKNEYFAQRASDLKDIKENLIRKILHIEKKDISQLEEPTILVAREIMPSTTAGMDTENVAGMLMELGGSTSHTAIYARTVELPAIIAVPGLLKQVQTGDMIAFDGESGEIFLHLNEEEAAAFRQRLKQQTERQQSLEKMAGKETVTADGVSMQIWGNIGAPEDAKNVLARGGTGIGLFRSEFLYLTSPVLPSEDHQFEAYKKVLETMENRPVIIRTLDIGGDKEVPALHLEKEANPYMGLRAIRLCRQKKDLFRIQLRALLRASAYGELRILFPMISSLEELRWAKQEVELCRAELYSQKIEVREEIPVGIMVELPAAALMSESLAKECDFFSIGTNDLTQYTLAVDRGNEMVADLYSYFHPAVVWLVKKIIESAHKNGISCGMCGEAAGDPKMTPLLVGWGLDEFSMPAASILETKALLRKLDTEECKALAKRILKLDTTAEIEQTLKTFLTQKGEAKLC